MYWHMSIVNGISRLFKLFLIAYTYQEQCKNLIVIYVTLGIDIFVHFRFKASLYPCPDTSGERREMVLGVSTRIEDVKAV